MIAASATMGTPLKRSDASLKLLAASDASLLARIAAKTVALSSLNRKLACCMAPPHLRCWDVVGINSQYKSERYQDCAHERE